jgi:hypothetical protein
MAITKQIDIDQITVNSEGSILYREVTRIIEDDVQLTQTYHRTSLFPGQDLTNQPPNVVAIANVVWTEEIIASFEAKQAEIAARLDAQQAGE